MSDDPRKAASYRPHPTLGDCRELAKPGDGPCWGAVQNRNPADLAVFSIAQLQRPPLPLCVGHKHRDYGLPYIEEYP